MNYTEDDCSPWFDGETKPAYPGIYQQRSGAGYHEVGYQVWNGYYWSEWSSTPDGAWRVRHHKASSSFQNDPWRGLKNNPSKTYSIRRFTTETIETCDIGAYAKQHGLQDWQIIETAKDGKTLPLSQLLQD